MWVELELEGEVDFRTADVNCLSPWIGGAEEECRRRRRGGRPGLLLVKIYEPRVGHYAKYSVFSSRSPASGESN